MKRKSRSDKRLPERGCTVRVRWRDAYYNGGKQISPGDAIDSYMEINSVGILYENNAKRVVLVTEQIGHDDTYRQFTVIPKSVVMEIEKIGDWNN